MLSHPREWMSNPGTQYRPGPVLEQHTRGPPRPAQGVGPFRRAHRRGAGPGAGSPKGPHSACGHIKPPGMHGTAAPRRGRIRGSRGGTVTGTPQPIQRAGPLVPAPTPLPLSGGHGAPPAELYHTHLERLGAQGIPQSPAPALPPGQGREALLQGPLLDTTTTVQQRGSSNADGGEPGRTNCGVVAWTAACRHLAWETTGLRQYRPADRTTLASTVAAVTMGPVAARPVRLLPHVPCWDTQHRQPATTHRPTALLMAEQLHVVAAALLADGGESFLHHHGPAQIAGSIQRPQRDAAHPWHATLCERTRLRDARGCTLPPDPSRGRHWCYRRRATRPSCTATPGATGRTS